MILVSPTQLYSIYLRITTLLCVLTGVTISPNYSTTLACPVIGCALVKAQVFKGLQKYPVPINSETSAIIFQLR